MAILKISALLGLLAVASASSLHAAGYPDHRLCTMTRVAMSVT